MKSFAHEIAGMPVHASDGEIGTIKDVVFDPQSWIVRHLEVSTGWLFGRDVLIPVEKVKHIQVPDGAVTFNLTKEQIENSPCAEPARPVDASYHRRLMGYYGLSSRWAAPPEVGMPPQTLPVEGPVATAAAPELLFAGEVAGYQLDAQGEMVGTVKDLLIELDTWKVASLMADLGGILISDSATVATGPVIGIDRANRIVHVSLSKEQVDRSHRTGIEDLPYVFPYVPPIA